MSNSDDPEPSISTTPWWKRPTVVAIGSAVVIAVATGWANQAATAVVDGLFGGEESSSPHPTLSVSSADHAFCGLWLLRESPQFVAQKIKIELKSLNGASNKEIEEGLERVRETSGSRAATGNRVDVTIEGDQEKAVILEELTLDVVKRSKMSKIMGVGDSCGGGFPARYFVANLDDPRPEFSLSRVDDEGNEVLEPIGFPYKVSSVEPEKFILTGKSKSVVEWTATLHWVADGKKGETKISDHGKPFVSYSEARSDYTFNTATRKLAPDS